MAPITSRLGRAGMLLPRSAVGPDVLGYRRVRHTALAVMFAAGATLALLTLVVPHGHRVDAGHELVVSSLGYPAALLVALAGRRLPEWALQVLLLGGTAIVSVGIYYGHDGGTAVAATFFYVWVGLYAFAFLRIPAAVLQVLAALAGYAVVLAIQRPAAAPAEMVLTAGTTITAGIVVAMMRAQLIAVAVSDPLTGLPNRRALDAVLRRDMARAGRSGSPLTVVLLDLDGLKAVNDRDGHGAGDELLTRAARGWLRTLRRSDMLARYGGDEFAMVLPDTGRPEAEHAVERLRVAVPSVPFSAGTASLQAGESAETLLGRADAELYRAKSGSRSRPAGAPVDLRRPLINGTG